MIYKTCFIAFWKKEAMLPHPVYLHKIKYYVICVHLKGSIFIYIHIQFQFICIRRSLYLIWKNNSDLTYS